MFACICSFSLLQNHEYASLSAQRRQFFSSQLCVNVAMVQLRRFFAIHPLQQFDARVSGADAKTILETIADF